MITEFQAHAKPTNSKAKFLFVLLLGIAAALTVTYIIIPLYKGIVGLFAVAAITAVVFIYTKYIGIEYYYDVTFDSAGTPVFVVRQLIGKRSTTCCRIDLHSIVKVERLTREEKSKHKTPVGFKSYVYFPTLSPDSSLLIKMSSPSEHAEIFIEATDEFGNLLLAYSREAREMRFED